MKQKVISKEKFVSIINRLRKYSDMEIALHQVCRNYLEEDNLDFVGTGTLCVGHSSTVVELLKFIFSDDSDVLDWWIWEKNFGREFKIGDFTYLENGEKVEVNLLTAESLYDYLVSELERKEEV